MIKRPCYPSDTVILCVCPFVRASCESGSESSSWPLHQLWQEIPCKVQRCCACIRVSLSLTGVSCFCLRVKCASVLQPWLYPPTSTSVCLCDLLQPFEKLSLVTRTSLSRCIASPHSHAISSLALHKESKCIACLSEYTHHGEHVIGYICKRLLNVLTIML